MALPESTEVLQVSEAFLIPLLIAEDPLFLRHHGVDFKRLRDDLRETIELGQYKRGSSTISMQLAKLRFLSQEKTLLRKLNQIWIALILESKYSKEQLLQAYLETVPFGDNVVGIKSAALRYFHKTPDVLSTSEALPLVVSIFNPIEYNPGIPVMPRAVNYRAITIRARGRVYSPALRRDLSVLKNIASSDK